VGLDMGGCRRRRRALGVLRGYCVWWHWVNATATALLTSAR
jgi:hypothetical protein